MNCSSGSTLLANSIISIFGTLGYSLLKQMVTPTGEEVHINKNIGLKNLLFEIASFL